MFGGMSVDTEVAKCKKEPVSDMFGGMPNFQPYDEAYANAQHEQDENDSYSNTELNIIRFRDINNSIIASLTKIYKEKLKYFLDITKSNIVSNMTEFIISSVGCQTMNGKNSPEEDIKLQHNISIHEMRNIDYTEYNFFESIKESIEFEEMRTKLNEDIAEYSTAINKLLELKDNASFSPTSVKSDIKINKSLNSDDFKLKCLIETNISDITNTDKPGIVLKINSSNLLTPENLKSSVS